MDVAVLHQGRGVQILLFAVENVVAFVQDGVFYGILLLRSASHRVVVGNKVDVPHGIGVVLAERYNLFTSGIGHGNVRQEEFEVDPLVSNGCVGDIGDVLFVEGEIPFVPQPGSDALALLFENVAVEELSRANERVGRSRPARYSLWSRRERGR